MARVLGIDYGKKRVGIAVTDPLKIVAGSLTTVESGEVMEFLTNYLSKEKVETIVIGLPKNLDNTSTDATAGAERFIAEVKTKFPSIRVESIDERFTSKMAMQRIVASGIKKKARQDKGLVDRTSATIILETFLEQQL